MMTAKSLSDFGTTDTNPRAVLEARYDLGTLCKWTGPAREWAISLATAIDEVMNILLIDNQVSLFKWPLDVQVDGMPYRILFKIKKEGSQWKSNFSEIERVLSLGLLRNKVIEANSKENREQAALTAVLESTVPKPTVSGPTVPKPAISKLDWLRSDEESEKKEQSITLLGLSTPEALRDLQWWIGP